MFNIKYNILVLIQITFGILNTLLLVKNFGVSAQSDAYLLSCAILTVLQLILIMPVMQFLPFYNEYKTVSLKKSQEFYNYLVLFSLVFGFIVCSLCYIGSPYIIKLFTLHIDIQRLVILKNLLSISMLGAFCYTVMELNTQLLNAERKFSMPYILATIPNACVVITQCIGMLRHSNNIYSLAYAQAIALLLCATVGLIYVNITLIRFKLITKFNGIFQFVKNSIGMQFGNSIYHIFFPTILNNYLSTFPTGYVSYFYYARKVIDIINNFTVGPSFQILRSNISKAFAKCDKLFIKNNSKKYMLFASCLLLGGSLVAYFVQAPIFKFINNSLTDVDLKLIRFIFISLIPWYLFMLLEGPSVLVNIMSKKFSILIKVNSSFIIIFVLCMICFSKHFGIYAIGLSTAIAQLFNFIWHYKYASKNLEEL